MPRALVCQSCGTGWNGTKLMVVRSAEKVRSCELSTSGELNITPIYQNGYIMSVYIFTHNGYLFLLQNGYLLQNGSLFITKWVHIFITKWAPSLLQNGLFVITKWVLITKCIVFYYKMGSYYKMGLNSRLCKLLW